MSAFVGLTPALVTALRVVGGVEAINSSLVPEAFETLLQLGYIERCADRLMLTDKGRRYLASMKRRKTVWRPSR